MRQGAACMHASVHVCVSVRVHTYGDWVGRGVGVPNLHIWKCFFSPRRLLCCGQMELESAQKPWRQTHQKKKKKKGRGGKQREASRKSKVGQDKERTNCCCLFSPSSSSVCKSKLGKEKNRIVLSVESRYRCIPWENLNGITEVGISSYVFLSSGLAGGIVIFV